MQINFSDETLDTLRFHLERAQQDVRKRATTAKRKGDIARFDLWDKQLADLIGIIADAQEPLDGLPEPHFDVTATGQGSVFHFALHTDAAIAAVKEHFAVADYQWLGARAFAVDHRFAPQVVVILRDNGIAVEVK